MPETCENWLNFVHSCVYHNRQTRDIYQVLPYSVVFKAPRSFEIHWVRQYLVNAVLFGIQDLQTYKMTVNLKSNFYVGAVNIFLIIDTDPM